jgi:cycloartenol synthase
VKDYLWAAEDGVKMQGYNGSQLWDTAFAAQAFLAADYKLAPEIATPLRNAFKYIRNTQIQRNEEDFEKWYRVYSMGE